MFDSWRIHDDGWCNMNGGFIGALVGFSCAAAAIGLNVWLHRRQGDTHPLRSTLGLSRDGVERRIYVQGASVAFPFYAVFVCLYLLAAGAPTMAGVLAGSAGFIYGVSSAWVGTRIAR